MTGFQSRDHKLAEPLSHCVFGSVEFLGGQIRLFDEEVDQLVQIEVGADLAVALPFAQHGLNQLHRRLVHPRVVHGSGMLRDQRGDGWVGRQLAGRVGECRFIFANVPVLPSISVRTVAMCRCERSRATCNTTSAMLPS